MVHDYNTPFPNQYKITLPEPASQPAKPSQPEFSIYSVNYLQRLYQIPNQYKITLPEPASQPAKPSRNSLFTALTIYSGCYYI